MNDSISLDWDLSDYRGVVLFGHNADVLPIGRAANLGVRGGWLRAGLVWSKSPFARAVRQQVDEGNLKGISVGFRPGEWQSSKTRPGGIDFVRGHKLLEFSVVNVAALPSAMFEGAAGNKSAADITPALQAAGTLSRDEAEARLARIRGPAVPDVRADFAARLAAIRRR